MTVLCFWCFDGYSKRQPVRLISAKFSGATEKTQLVHKTTAKHEKVTTAPDLASRLHMFACIVLLCFHALIMHQL